MALRHGTTTDDRDIERDSSENCASSGDGTEKNEERPDKNEAIVRKTMVTCKVANFSEGHIQNEVQGEALFWVELKVVMS
ncbi:hypothetical protein KP509_09G016000 [Ceratopteris richardii]|uniref:Uncharacterized protein n=1 Tax=Ceratopteris richardii TaxID=49495 RepID=A0A8T2TZ81_CERRI|nr:hypothetical protein KP509_09G016000 [Ceratopteris richardii]